MERQNISGNFKAELTLLNLLNTIHVSQFIKKNLFNNHRKNMKKFKIHPILKGNSQGTCIKTLISQLDGVRVGRSQRHEMPKTVMPFSRRRVIYVRSSIYLCLALSSFILGRISYGLDCPQIHYATENDIKLLIIQPPTLGMLEFRRFT